MKRIKSAIVTVLCHPVRFIAVLALIALGVIIYNSGYSEGKSYQKSIMIDSLLNVHSVLDDYKDSLEMAKDELFYFTGDRNYNCD